MKWSRISTHVRADSTDHQLCHVFVCSWSEIMFCCVLEDFFFFFFQLENCSFLQILLVCHSGTGTLNVCFARFLTLYPKHFFPIPISGLFWLSSSQSRLQFLIAFSLCPSSLSVFSLMFNPVLHEKSLWLSRNYVTVVLVYVQCVSYIVLHTAVGTCFFCVSFFFHVIFNSA